MTDTARLEALYCAVFDVQPGASREELRPACIFKVRMAHPDRFQWSPALREIAEAWMKQINEAYGYPKRLGDRRPPRDECENAARSSGNREERSQERVREAPAVGTPPTKSKPHWPASLMVILTCHGAIRIAALLSAWSFPVVVATAWAYTLI
jgi:hypothetical protein